MATTHVNFLRLRGGRCRSLEGPPFLLTFLEPLFGWSLLGAVRVSSPACRITKRRETPKLQTSLAMPVSYRNSQTPYAAIQQCKRAIFKKMPEGVGGESQQYLMGSHRSHLRSSCRAASRRSRSESVAPLPGGMTRRTALAGAFPGAHPCCAAIRRPSRGVQR